MAELDPSGPERRLRAKRQNERVKLIVSFLNTLSLAWLPAALLLHMSAHAAFSLLKSED